MTDLPKDWRQQLSADALIQGISPVQTQIASDQTVKCLFGLPSGRNVESVLIPDFDKDNQVKRLTVCVSSQVGCAMGCTFCATGLMGFQQNLTAGQIYDQVWQLNQLAHTRFGRGVTNIVYMGMGEPLQNYSEVLKSIALLTDEEGLGLAARRITVSTVGLARRIRQLADDGVRFNLAVSLHAPTDEKRSTIMPVNRNERTDIASLVDALAYFTAHTSRRITFEYCMFAGFNDSLEDARHLANLANRFPSKVNLIMYNPVPGLPFRRTSEDHLDHFIQVLTLENVVVTVRRSRGQDIAAACGQLAVDAGA
jgi:23S rRNA (adenine2503-C2)-methyltransferase